MSYVEEKKFLYEMPGVASPGCLSLISDPDFSGSRIQQQQKTGVGKNLLFHLFCSHKISQNCLFNFLKRVQKKIYINWQTFNWFSILNPKHFGWIRVSRTRDPGKTYPESGSARLEISKYGVCTWARPHGTRAPPPVVCPVSPAPWFMNP